MVRQFSKHYNPGIQRLAPSLAQVVNALRAESELDARSNDLQSTNMCSVQTLKKQTAGTPKQSATLER